LNTALLLLLPPTLTLALAFGLRLLVRQYEARVALVPLAAGLLISWVVAVRPGWMPVDDVNRVVHITVGAFLLGLLLDALQPRRLVTAVLAGGFVLGCAFACVTGRLFPAGGISLSEGLWTGGLAAAAFLVLARFDAMRERALSLMLVLTLLAAGLAVLAAIAQDASLAGLSLVLAAALAGYALFVAVMGGQASDGIVLVTASPLLAIVWALAQGHPDLRLALGVLPLVLFAEATALKVPLPRARISAWIYPLILAFFVSLPLTLAALIAFVTSVP
jgi:hypothetical protein